MFVSFPFRSIVQMHHNTLPSIRLITRSLCSLPFPLISYSVYFRYVSSIVTIFLLFQCAPTKTRTTEKKLCRRRGRRPIQIYWNLCLCCCFPDTTKKNTMNYSSVLHKTPKKSMQRIWIKAKYFSCKQLVFGWLYSNARRCDRKEISIETPAEQTDKREP